MRLNYWKCPKCHGSGRVIPIPGHAASCEACDGTGNALVDGAAARHRRALERIDSGDFD